MQFRVCQIILVLALSLEVHCANPPIKNTIQSLKSMDADGIDPQFLIEIIEAQLAAIHAGKIDEAYHEYTSSGFKKNTTPEQFKQFTNIFSVISENQSLQFNSINSEKSIITLEGVLQTIKGESLQAEYDLVQENGKWKILGIQIFKSETTNAKAN